MIATIETLAEARQRVIDAQRALMEERDRHYRALREAFDRDLAENPVDLRPIVKALRRAKKIGLPVVVTSRFINGPGEARGYVRSVGTQNLWLSDAPDSDDRTGHALRLITGVRMVRTDERLDTDIAEIGRMIAVMDEIANAHDGTKGTQFALDGLRSAGLRLSAYRDDLKKRDDLKREEQS